MKIKNALDNLSEEDVLRIAEELSKHQRGNGNMDKNTLMYKTFIEIHNKDNGYWWHHFESDFLHYISIKYRFVAKLVLCAYPRMVID